jgi:hypothetical protein
VPHHLFVDEAGQYLTEDAAAILDQARKFGLHFTLCVQTLAQIRDRGEKLFVAILRRIDRLRRPPVAAT